MLHSQKVLCYSKNLVNVNVVYVYIQSYITEDLRKIINKIRDGSIFPDNGWIKGSLSGTIQIMVCVIPSD